MPQFTYTNNYLKVSEYASYPYFSVVLAIKFKSHYILPFEMGLEEQINVNIWVQEDMPPEMIAYTPMELNREYLGAFFSIVPVMIPGREYDRAHSGEIPHKIRSYGPGLDETSWISKDEKACLPMHTTNDVARAVVFGLIEEYEIDRYNSVQKSDFVLHVFSDYKADGTVSNAELTKDGIRKNRNMTETEMKEVLHEIYKQLQPYLTE